MGSMDPAAKDTDHDPDNTRDHLDHVDGPTMSRPSNAGIPLLERSGLGGTRFSSSALSPSGLSDTLLQAVRGYSESLFKVTAVLLLLLMENVFQNKLFVCPCTSDQLNAAYSMAFTFVPAGLLLGVGIMSNTTTWRALTGCCFRRKVFRYGCRDCIRVLSEIVPGALVAPYIWIVYAFLDGRFYECAFRDEAVCDDPDRKWPWNPRLEGPEKVQTSQMIAYVLLVVGLAAYTLCICITRMRSPYPYEFHNYLKLYEDEFTTQKELLVREFSRQTARSDIHHFIENFVEEKGESEGVGLVKGKRRGTNVSARDKKTRDALQVILDHRRERAARDTEGDRDHGGRQSRDWSSRDPGGRWSRDGSESRDAGGRWSRDGPGSRDPGGRWSHGGPGERRLRVRDVGAAGSCDWLENMVISQNNVAPDGQPAEPKVTVDGDGGTYTLNDKLTTEQKMGLELKTKRVPDRQAEEDNTEPLPTHPVESSTLQPNVGNDSHDNLDGHTDTVRLEITSQRWRPAWRRESQHAWEMLTRPLLMSLGTHKVTRTHSKTREHDIVV